VLLQNAAPSSYRVLLKAGRTVESRRSLQREVVSALETGVDHVIVDCRDWSELDLMVLSSLVSCANACDQRGANFELDNLRPNIRSCIEALSVGDRVGLGGATGATIQ